MSDEAAYSFSVPKGAAGTKLLSFLKKELGERFSAKAIKKAIESGACRLNGRIITYAAHALRHREKIEFFQKAPLKKIPFSAPILYEDEYFLIVDKPIGVACDEEFVEKTLPPEYAKCCLVHRLDKNTSGVLILAKDKKTEDAFIDLFKTQKIQKEYLAIVDGKMAKDEGTIESLITLKDEQKGKKVLTSDPIHGKKSITEWKMLSQSTTSSLLLCKPITGRTHQIRVHLSSIGHPIIGDAQYSKRPLCRYFAPRPLLHAYTISFMHPITAGRLNIKASLPKDFEKALKELELQPS